MGFHNDLTFFTNEDGRNLYDRFDKVLKSNTKFYDMLVGYFRTSGFYLKKHLILIPSNSM